MSLTHAFATALNAVGYTTDRYAAVELFNAIAKDEAVVVDELLKKNPAAIHMHNPESREDMPDLLPLAFALHYQNINSAAVMAQRFPALLTKEDENGATELTRLIRGGATDDTFLAFIRLGVDLAHKDSAGNTYLHEAALQYDSWREPASVLLGLNKLEVDARNNKGETPLMLAGGKGSMGLVVSLIKNKAAINATDDAGLNATMHALRSSNLVNAEYLMRNGGVVDFNDPAVDIQRGVAAYEGDIMFLETLEKRQRQQEDDLAASKSEAAALGENAAAQALAQQVEGVVAAVAGGVDETAAPAKALFRKKIPVPAA